MKVTLSLNIDSSNDAFDAAEVEVARILRDTATKIEAGHTLGRLRDFNGNSVGNFDLYIEEDNDDT